MDGKLRHCVWIEICACCHFRRYVGGMFLCVEGSEFDLGVEGVVGFDKGAC